MGGSGGWRRAGERAGGRVGGRGMGRGAGVPVCAVLLHGAARRGGDRDHPLRRRVQTQAPPAVPLCPPPGDFFLWAGGGGSPGDAIAVLDRVGTWYSKERGGGVECVCALAIVGWGGAMQRCGCLLASCSFRAGGRGERVFAEARECTRVGGCGSALRRWGLIRGSFGVRD